MSDNRELRDQHEAFLHALHTGQSSRAELEVMSANLIQALNTQTGNDIFVVDQIYIPLDYDERRLFQDV